MSVPPDIMKAMSGAGAQMGPAQGATPGGSPNPNAAAPPAAAPISQPQDKKGLKAAAMTNVHIALNMLEEALPAFGAESPEGQKILSGLRLLGPLAAKRDNSDLVPAEVMQMVKSLPQMGGGSQVQQQIMQMMSQAKGGQQPPRMQ